MNSRTVIKDRVLPGIWRECRSYMVILILCLLPFAVTPSTDASAEKWPGVDEKVVEKFAKEHGREAKPLLDLEGDAQLFAFLVAGVLGGFAAGYYWRMLVAEKKRQER